MSRDQITELTPDLKWKIARERLFEAASVADEDTRNFRIEQWLDKYIKHLQGSHAISKTVLRHHSQEKLMDYVDHDMAHKFADQIRKEGLFNKTQESEFERWTLERKPWSFNEERYHYRMLVVDLGGV